MTKIVLMKSAEGTLWVDSEDLVKPNWANSGKTAKALILADPDKSGYSKAYLDKLKSAGVLTQAECDGAKAKASK